MGISLEFMILVVVVIPLLDIFESYLVFKPRYTYKHKYVYKLTFVLNAQNK